MILYLRILLSRASVNVATERKGRASFGLQKILSLLVGEMARTGYVTYCLATQFDVY